jgi:fatty-acyl-CoA synthase
MSVQDAGARPQTRTLARVLDEKTALAPNHPAIFFDDRVISYAELQVQSLRAARALLAAGIRSGDRIGVMLGNEPDWVVMSMAAAYVGAGFVPLNTWYKQAEIAWTLRHCNLKLLVSASDFIKTDYVALFETLIPELKTSAPDGALTSAAFPELRAVVFAGRRTPGTGDWDSFLKSGDALSAAHLHVATTAVSPDQAAFVLYTSGSTADPKGVLLNHRGVVENGYDLGERRGIGPDDRVWVGSPLFYGLGATNALPATLTHGASLVLQGSFEAGAAIEVVRRTGSTVYYGTGNMTRAMLDHPDYAQAKIGSLKKGNAGTVAEYKRLTLVEMGITGAVPAYGLTETYGNATVGLPDDPIAVKIATNGRPLPGMEMIVVDPQTGRHLPQGETGLVLIKGHTTPGYLNNPDETAKALRPDGFFDTGDLGFFDPDGRFIFQARLKEVIKSGGINVSPLEVEQLLAGHPDVRDAFVVGVAHPVKGELVVAFVDRSADVSESDLRGYIKERAASFKVPHHVLFRSEDQLPRLASGKIAKHRLAEEARQELGLTGAA